MASLIITASDFSAGSFIKAKMADCVVGLDHRLVGGAAPFDADEEAFFGPAALQTDKKHWLSLPATIVAQRFGETRPGLIELCARFESIELWIDPFANAHLILIQLLNLFKSSESLWSKLSLVQTDQAIVTLDAKDLEKYRQAAHKVEAAHLNVAATAWRAFRQETPVAWAKLIFSDLSALPKLGHAVLDLLNELPAPVTALGATEATLLKAISKAAVSPEELFRSPDISHVFYFWDLGQMLHVLSHAPCPAILGLEEGPLSLELLDDSDRRRRYMNAKLSLSPFGKNLMEGRADFSAANPIQRWWGQTLITNQQLWRWDAAQRALISP